MNQNTVLSNGTAVFSHLFVEPLDVLCDKPYSVQTRARFVQICFANASGEHGLSKHSIVRMFEVNPRRVEPGPLNRRRGSLGVIARSESHRRFRTV